MLMQKHSPANVVDDNVVSTNSLDTSTHSIGNFIDSTNVNPNISVLNSHPANSEYLDDPKSSSDYDDNISSSTLVTTNNTLLDPDNHNSNTSISQVLTSTNTTSTASNSNINSKPRKKKKKSSNNMKVKFPDDDKSGIKLKIRRTNNINQDDNHVIVDNESNNNPNNSTNTNMNNFNRRRQQFPSNQELSKTKRTKFNSDGNTSDDTNMTSKRTRNNINNNPSTDMSDVEDSNLTNTSNSNNGLISRCSSVGINTCSVGTEIDESMIGPCQPGTKLSLESVVLMETESGILIVSVQWRGKTLTGSLMETERYEIGTLEKDSIYRRDKMMALNRRNTRRKAKNLFGKKKRPNAPNKSNTDCDLNSGVGTENEGNSDTESNHPYICDKQYCQKRFSDLQALRIHIYQIHRLRNRDASSHNNLSLNPNNSTSIIPPSVCTKLTTNLSSTSSLISGGGGVGGNSLNSNAFSPAYSDISDANEAPVLERNETADTLPTANPTVPSTVTTTACIAAPANVVVVSNTPNTNIMPQSNPPTTNNTNHHPHHSTTHTNHHHHHHKSDIPNNIITGNNSTHMNNSSSTTNNSVANISSTTGVSLSNRIFSPGAPHLQPEVIPTTNNTNSRNSIVSTPNPSIQQHNSIPTPTITSTPNLIPDLGLILHHSKPDSSINPNLSLPQDLSFNSNSNKNTTSSSNIKTNNKFSIKNTNNNTSNNSVNSLPFNHHSYTNGLLHQSATYPHHSHHNYHHSHHHHQNYGPKHHHTNSNSSNSGNTSLLQQNQFIASMQKITDICSSSNAQQSLLSSLSSNQLNNSNNQTNNTNNLLSPNGAAPNMSNTNNSSNNSLQQLFASNNPLVFHNNSF